jgi:hypothetical protein
MQRCVTNHSYFFLFKREGTSVCVCVYLVPDFHFTPETIFLTHMEKGQAQFYRFFFFLNSRVRATRNWRTL